MYNKICNILTYITKNEDCKDHKYNHLTNIKDPKDLSRKNQRYNVSTDEQFAEEKNP